MKQISTPDTNFIIPNVNLQYLKEKKNQNKIVKLC